MNTIIKITEAAIEYLAENTRMEPESAQELLSHVLTLCEFESQREQDLERRLWEVNSALVRAGIFPASLPSFAAAIDELARRAKPGGKGNIERAAQVGAEIVLDIITGWRRDPIPFSKEETAYKITKRLREALEEGEPGSG